MWSCCVVSWWPCQDSTTCYPSIRKLEEAAPYCWNHSLLMFIAHPAGFVSIAHNNKYFQLNYYQYNKTTSFRIPALTVLCTNFIVSVECHHNPHQNKMFSCHYFSIINFIHYCFTKLFSVSSSSNTRIISLCIYEFWYLLYFSMWHLWTV